MIKYDNDRLDCDTGHQAVDVVCTSMCTFRFNRSRQMCSVSIENVSEILRLYQNYQLSVSLISTIDYFLLGASCLDVGFQDNKEHYMKALELFGKEHL